VMMAMMEMREHDDEVKIRWTVAFVNPGSR
jgi:hypothetical protein